jgi:O-antigen/teichoic acid export membrane protein
MSRPPAALTPPTTGGVIRRNAGFSLLSQIVGATFTAGLTLFLARRLGTHGFGVYSLALGIGSLVLFPMDFGISTSMARFVAEHRRDRAGVASVVADGLRLKFLLGLAMSAGLFALAGPLASAFGTHDLLWPVRAIAIALLGQTMMQTTSVFQALGRVGFQLSTATIESASEVTASVALVLAGAGVTGAAFGRAFGYLIGGGLTVVLLVRLVGPGSFPRTLRLGENTRRIGTYAGVILITDGAFTLFNQVDVLVIGAYLGTSAVGIFSAPVRLTGLLGYPGLAISTGVSPLQARNQPGGPNIAAFSTALRVLLIIQAAATAFVLGWADLIVKVTLGSHFGESASVLRALAPFVFLLGFGPLASGTVNYLGEARRRVPIAIATALINLIVDLLLVPRIGVIGGSVGTDLAYALYAPAHLYICQRELRLDLRPAAATLVRTLLAGAATTGVLLLVGSPLDEVWRIVLGGVAGLSVFVIILRVSGELKSGEARALLSQVPLLRRLGAARAA